METMNTGEKLESNVYAGEEPSRIKQKLGDLGRRIKRVDLRGTIVAHPFAAVGIAAGVGALVGLARPMPRRGPVSGLLGALMSTIAFKVAREAAFKQLFTYAKNQFGSQEDANRGMSAQAPQAGTVGY